MTSPNPIVRVPFFVTPMNYRPYLVLATLCVACLTPFASAAPRPNILFIFSDDHAQNAISAYGSKVNTTPHLDRLARGGARFTNSFVTNSICTPSRATLLTGQYSHLNGVPVFNRFDGSRDTVAKHLQAGGYHTGMIGKWHLGSDPTGFDRWIVLPGQGQYWNPSFLTPHGRLDIEGHCTDITGALPENEQTVARDLTNRDLKFMAPDNLKGPELRAWASEKPMAVTVDGKTLTGKALVKWKYQHYMRDYLACVQGVDDNVGKVLDYLDATGLAENTIVIYSADNGWYLGDLGLYDKRFMYEPGLRVPLIARGPGIKAGTTPDQFVGNIDLAPTFLDLAGLPIPESMQGHSVAPILRGESPADWRETFYYRYYHSPGHHNTAAHYGVRTRTHKLIYYWDKDAFELFDLVNDPDEQHNMLYSPIEAKRPAVQKLFAELKAEITRLQQVYHDDGQYADPATWPKGGVDGVGNDLPRLGTLTVHEAMAQAVPGQ